MSWPTPAVVLQALNRAVAPDSTRSLRRTIARPLRIGNFLRRGLVGGNDLQPRLTRPRVDLDQERVKNANRRGAQNRELHRTGPPKSYHSAAEEGVVERQKNDSADNGGTAL